MLTKKNYYIFCAFLLFISLTLEQKTSKCLRPITQAKCIQIEFKYKNSQQSHDQPEITGSLTIYKNQYTCTLDTQWSTTCNGTTTWTYMPNEIQITNDPPDENPWIQLKNYKKTHKTLRYTHGKNNYDVVELISLDQNHPFPLVKITLTPKKLHEIQLTDQSLVQHTLCITSYKTPNNINSSYFNFDPKQYPECTVVDLR